MKNVLTASERRGILVVAALSLVITGAGWIVSMCQRSVPQEAMPEVEVLLRGDSVSESRSDGDSVKKKRRRRSRKDSVGNKRNPQPMQYRKRSPIDEIV